ncbi:MAG: hypothetical protein GY721_01460 [Deltaproteobacteria bacterium]|nr:hypothetical protein [Deltaproteobacteria bacterium]
MPKKEPDTPVDLAALFLRIQNDPTSFSAEEARSLLSGINKTARASRAGHKRTAPKTTPADTKLGKHETQEKSKYLPPIGKLDV